MSFFDDQQRVKVRVRIRPFIPHVIPSEAFKVPSVTMADDKRIVVVPPSIETYAMSKAPQTDVNLHSPRFNPLLTSARKLTPLPASQKPPTRKVTVIQPAVASPTSPATNNNKNSGGASVYSFDSVHDMNCTQADIFEDCEVADLIDAVLDGGTNASVLCYGPTGSGKTHTMTGAWAAGDSKKGATESDGGSAQQGSDKFGSDLGSGLGVLPRCVHSLLLYQDSQLSTKVATSTRPTVTSISLFAFELYLDQVYDLLSPKKAPVVFRDGVGPEGGPSTLLLDLTTTNKSGVTSARLRTMDQFATAYRLLSSNRMTSAHKRNDQSSRSHVIYLLRLDFASSHSNIQTQPSAVRRGPQPSFLALVDLAGSERLDTTGINTEQGVQEAQFINKSLSALSSVVFALHTGGKHVPYRDSKLTRLLRPCFESASITALIHVPPGPDTCDEALCTLKFAQRLQEVKLLDTVAAVKACPEGLTLRALANEAVSVRDLLSGFEEVASVHAALAAELRMANATHGHVPKRISRLVRRKYIEALESDLGSNDASNKENATSYSSPVRKSLRDYIFKMPTASQSVGSEILAASAAASLSTAIPMSSFLWKVADDESERTLRASTLSESLEVALEPLRLQQILAEEASSDVLRQNAFLKLECAALEERNREEGEAALASTRNDLKHIKKRELICLDIVSILQKRLRELYKADRHMDSIWDTFEGNLKIFETQNDEISTTIKQLQRECYCRRYTAHSSKQAWSLLLRSLTDLESLTWEARGTVNAANQLRELQIQVDAMELAKRKNEENRRTTHGKEVIP